MRDKMKKRDERSGLAIPAFLLIGIGVGFLLGNVVALTLIGLGVGFLVMFLVGKKR
jgi:divalent metal cation (Fe/Co/Zn/Cd) transporter